MERDEFADCRFERNLVSHDHSYRLEASWWQKIWEWEPPTIDLDSPLKSEEIIVKDEMSPDFWQKLPFGEKLARIGKEKRALRPAWWQKIFSWNNWSKSANNEEMLLLKPAWWQRLFQRMPKLPD